MRGANSKEILEKARAEGKYIVGLEVTDITLQPLHDLNIDPQHTDNIEKRIDTSAIDYVSKNIFTVLEEAGNKDLLFTTNRADLDSIGAMTLLTMESESRVAETRDIEVVKRVEEINKYDNYTNGARWKPQEVKEAVKTNEKYGAINKAVMDFTNSVENRVKIMEEWLKKGSVPEKYIVQSDAEMKALLVSIEDGNTEIRVEDKIAVVKSIHLKGLDIGYAKSPVVIAYNDKFKQPGQEQVQLKFTIAQYPNYKIVNFDKAKANLNAQDKFVTTGNEWGGPANLLASPMKTGSGLELEKVKEILLGSIDKQALEESFMEFDVGIGGDVSIDGDM